MHISVLMRYRCRCRHSCPRRRLGWSTCCWGLSSSEVDVSLSRMELPELWLFSSRTWRYINTVESLDKNWIRIFERTLAFWSQWRIHKDPFWGIRGHPQVLTCKLLFYITRRVPGGFDVDLVFFNQSMWLFTWLCALPAVLVLSTRTLNWRNHCETSWNGRQHGVAYGCWSILRIWRMNIQLFRWCENQGSTRVIPVRFGSGHHRLRLGQAKHDLATPAWDLRSWERCHSGAKNSSWRVARGCKGGVLVVLYYSILANGIYLQVSLHFTPHLERIMLRNFPTNPANISSMMGNSAPISYKKDIKTASRNSSPLTVSVSAWRPPWQHFCEARSRTRPWYSIMLAFTKSRCHS